MSLDGARGARDGETRPERLRVGAREGGGGGAAGARDDTGLRPLGVRSRAALPSGGAGVSVYRESCIPTGGAAAPPASVFAMAMREGSVHSVGAHDSPAADRAQPNHAEEHMADPPISDSPIDSDLPPGISFICALRIRRRAKER